MKFALFGHRTSCHSSHGSSRSNASSSIDSSEASNTTTISKLCIESELEAQDAVNEALSKQSRSKQRERERQRAVRNRRCLPSERALADASLCLIYDEFGQQREFGDLLWEDNTEFQKRTVVIFVRHMWCGLCHAFLRFMADKDLDRAIKQGIEIVIIGCGDPKMIGAYLDSIEWDRSIGKMYSDPSFRLQSLLGMTYKTLDPGSESEKGEYITKSMLQNVMESTINTFKNLGSAPGAFDRIGGEFVFYIDADTKETQCSYAFRMTNTRNHGSVKDLFRAAGVDVRHSKSLLEECSDGRCYI